MPELAEVEYFRSRWNPGIGRKVTRVALQGGKRIFRGASTQALEKTLTGAMLISSETKGKQMLFRFNKAAVGIHLGMTGHLHAEAGDFAPGKHDHLVLYQKGRALVFTDPRLFGRVLFHEGKGEPEWWAKLPADIISKEFTKGVVRDFLRRRKGAPIKAVLLMQECFLGIGNWMADEILWRARIHPARKAGALSEEEADRIWGETRRLGREALRIIGRKWDDPPDSWLFNHRWGGNRHCPRCGGELRRREIGGRTTCWCARCQPERRG